MHDSTSNTGPRPTVFPGYVSFKLSNLVPDTLTPCDVFFEAFSERLGRTSLTLALRKDHPVESVLLEDLASQGIVHSYAKQEDLGGLQQYLFILSADSFSGLSKQERVELLYNSAICTIKAAMLEPRNGRRLAMGVRVVRNLVNTVYDSMLTTKRLLALMTISNDVFNHSIKACLLGAGFAKFLGWMQNDTEELALALFYHDLGLVVYGEADEPNPFGVILKLEETDQDHPTRSRDFLTQLPEANPRVLDTVQNHHENLDCSGFPRGLCGDKLSETSRIARITDFYEIHTSGDDKNSSPYVALKMMNIDMAEKLDQKLVQEFVVYLGRLS